MFTFRGIGIVHFLIKNAMDLKRQLEISKLNRMLAFLYNKNDYAVQYSFFEWCVKGLMLEEMFETPFRVSGKELLKHFDIPEVNTLEEINNYFIEIYNVHHPIRNNVETMDNIEEVRQYLNSF